MREYTGVNAAIIEDPKTRDIVARMDLFLRDVARAMGNLKSGLSPEAGGIEGLTAGGIKTETTVGKTEATQGIGHVMAFPSPTPGNLQRYTFPELTGTVAFVDVAQNWLATQTWLASQVFGAPLTVTEDGLLRLENGGFDVSDPDAPSYTVGLYVTLPTADRVIRLPDVTGTLTARVGSTLDLTGQTANLSATNLATTPGAGVYRVGIYAVTRAVLGGALTITLAWTDTEQAQTKTLTLATPDGSYIDTASTINVASGSVTVAVTGYVSGTYDLWARIEALN